MKFLYLFMFLAFVNTFNVYAQENEVVLTPEFKAEPVGGMRSFYLAFMRKFNAPEIPVDQSEIKVKLNFIIETDGSLSEITMDGETEEIRNEILRVMKLMPEWKPALNAGEPVRSKFFMPISIKVTKENQLKK